MFLLLFDSSTRNDKWRGTACVVEQKCNGADEDKRYGTELSYTAISDDDLFGFIMNAWN
jgi:hypothetical protein